MLIVTSHAGHVELRSAHRRAYPRVDLLGLGLRRVFLLARQPQHQDDADREARALRDEGRRFKDIVQGDFVEAYRNLTYKHTMGLLWATRYCPQARLVIKMDDDIVVDLYQFVDVVKKHQQQRPHQVGELCERYPPFPVGARGIAVTADVCFAGGMDVRLRAPRAAAVP